MNVKTNNTSDMTIEEIDNLIQENNQKISILKEKCEQEKKEKQEKFNEVLELIQEITNTKKLYYDYRTILGSPFFSLSESEYSTIEEMMPIYEQKIKLLENKFKTFDFKKIL